MNSEGHAGFILHGWKESCRDCQEKQDSCCRRGLRLPAPPSLPFPWGRVKAGVKGQGILGTSLTLGQGLLITQKLSNGGALNSVAENLRIFSWLLQDIATTMEVLGCILHPGSEPMPWLPSLE